MSYRGPCASCGQPVDPERDGRRAAYRVSGYEVERDAGGTNHVRNRERHPGLVWHERCLPDPRVNEAQEALL